MANIFKRKKDEIEKNEKAENSLEILAKENKEKVIYVITTFEKAEHDRNGCLEHGNARSVAWFSDYWQAKKYVENNICDIHETIYDYAVIETLPEGIYPTDFGDIDGVYKCDYFKYNIETGKYDAIDASEVEISNVFSTVWSIG